MNPMRSFTLTVCALLFGCALLGHATIPAHAQVNNVRYVDPVTGADGINDCLNAAAPCQTIQHALSVAALNDAIDLAAGTYVESGLVISQDLVVRGAGVGQTVVDAGQNDRHFTVQAGVTRARFRDMTLTNGWQALAQGGSLLIEGGDVDVFDVEFVDNVAADGGAIYKASGYLYINDSTFANNEAQDGDGGAIYAQDNRTRIIRSVFVDNLAGLGQGGGIHAEDGRLVVLNSTFNNNAAPVGGAISLVDPAEAGITNATFYANQGWFGGTGGTISSGTTADFRFANNIVHDVSGASCNITNALAYPDLGRHNLINDTTCDSGAIVDFIFGGVVAGVDLDVNLQNNGGPTLTHMLPAGSSAIDNGASDCREPFVNNPLPWDQRHVSRPQGAVCDIGAVEAQ